MPGLASQKAISFKHYRTAQSTAVQAKGCGEVSNELCQVCIQFAVEAINIILNLILGEPNLIGAKEATPWYCYLKCSSSVHIGLDLKMQFVIS